MTNIEVSNSLNVIKNIIDLDLLPYFDGFTNDFVPMNTIVETDWLTLIKSDPFNPDVFITYSQSFIDYCANGNNFLALKNDALAYSRIKASPTALNLYFSSVCTPLLPVREVTIPTFNTEPMTGQVFIISYRPYTAAGSYTTIYFELRKRVSGSVLKRVLYDSTADDFNPVNALITKETLGSWYSSTASYNYETSASIRVFDV